MRKYLKRGSGIPAKEMAEAENMIPMLESLLSEGTKFYTGSGANKTLREVVASAHSKSFTFSQNGKNVNSEKVVDITTVGIPLRKRCSTMLISLAILMNQGRLQIVT